MTNIAQLPVQTVDTRYTQDLIPMLDTSKFEHMQRIATVMARSSVIPESLRKGKNENGQEVWLTEDVVIANCFRIVNQAVRWGMDPFAVADCASIVHGRLMWEGKLIAAIIDTKLGVRLSYAFTDEDKPVDSQKLGIVVSGMLPGETVARTVEGRVSDWHRGAKSPWANPGAWKRQLRYMGAREWARAHAPAVVLGVYTDDEFDGMMQRDVPTGQRAVRLKDITPKPEPALKPAAAIPFDEIPDPAASKPATAPAAAAPVDDGPLGDENGYVAHLAGLINDCESAEELAEIEADAEPTIKRLSERMQMKARDLFDERRGD